MNITIVIVNHDCVSKVCKVCFFSPLVFKLTLKVLVTVHYYAVQPKPRRAEAGKTARYKDLVTTHTKILMVLKLNTISG